MPPAYLPPSLPLSISIPLHDPYILSLHYADIIYNTLFTKTYFNFLFSSKTSAHLMGQFS